MLLSLALALVPQVCPTGTVPADVQRYQPAPIDPGLDGGLDRSFSRGEFTPDGRLLIAFRRHEDPNYPSNFRYALTASVTRSDRLLPDASNGHLEAFFTEDPSFTPPSTETNLYGSDFAFGGFSLPPATGPDDREWAFIHWGHEFLPCGFHVCQVGQPCVDPCIQADPGCNLNEDVIHNPDFPLPDSNGSSQMTVTLRPLDTQGLANPYASDADGNPDVSGGHTTYELWVVRLHNRGYAGTYVCNQTGGALVKPTTNNADSIFTSQNVTVVIDDAAERVVKTAVAPHEELETDQGAVIEGIEPSITADGKLMLFHGDGDSATTSPGDAVVTYVFNPDGCSPTGWTRPRSITEPPLQSELGGMTIEQFENTYRIFKNPIRMPASTEGPTPNQPHDYAVGENVTGTYPWVSKDGSFWNAYSVRSTDAYDSNNCMLSFRTKSGAYVCGDLTNWTIKHIDDPGLNPTRLGGPWAWPVTKNFNEPCANVDYPNSWGAITMGSGVKPGLWEPLIGDKPLFPTMDAGRRIPVMPLFLPVIDTYGEIRFEAADGDYLLYLPCNESLAVDPNPITQTPSGQNLNGEPFLFDANSTPDASGSGVAVAELMTGAAFPQEVYDNSPGSSTYEEATTLLRADVGAVLHPDGLPFHENVGFRGQGIVFSDEGHIKITRGPALDGLKEASLQMFVKCVGNAIAPSGQSVSLYEHGLTFQSVQYPVLGLEAESDGTLAGYIWVQSAFGLQELRVQSDPGALTTGHALADQSAGWVHVAMTYRSDDETGRTTLHLYQDGTLVHCRDLPAVSSVPNFPTLPKHNRVGPGVGTASGDVTKSNAVFVVDEVAVSRVERTQDEIRRDAFVPPLEIAEDWPIGDLPLPTGLDESEAHWSPDWDYQVGRATLGQQLFEDPALSLNNDIACSDCHDDSKSFTDSPSQFPTHNGTQLSNFNTPTLFNMAFTLPKTFEGQAAILEEQIPLPIEGLEMGPQSLAAVVTELAPVYDADFQNHFGELSEDTLIAALAMYVRTLTVGGSAFDTNPNGLNADAQRGRELFFGKARCFNCHRGSNFSDGDFHNIRTVQVGSPVIGLSNTTGRDFEEGMVKTPTLRNLSSTKPYFHDGSRAELSDVINHYNDPFVGLGTNVKGNTDRELRALNLDTQEKTDLEAFLRSLDG